MVNLNLPGRITLGVGLSWSAAAVISSGPCFGGRPCDWQELVLEFSWLAMIATGVAFAVSIATEEKVLGKKLRLIGGPVWRRLSPMFKLNLPGGITLGVGLIWSAAAVVSSGPCFGGRPCHWQEHALQFSSFATIATGVAFAVSIATGEGGLERKMGLIGGLALLVLVTLVLITFMSFVLYPPLI